MNKEIENDKKSEDVTEHQVQEKSASVDTSPMPSLHLSYDLPLDSKIKNEGIVYIRAKQSEALIDSMWVIQSSGYAAVDSVALRHLGNLSMEVVGTKGSFVIRVDVRLRSE